MRPFDRPGPGFMRCVLPAVIVCAGNAMAAAQTAPVSPEPGRTQASIVRPKPQSVGVADSVSLWPGGIVYYQIDSSSGDMTGIMAAIDKFNADFTGVIQWQEGTGTGTYVEIYLDPGDNSAAGDVNTIGYPLYPPAVVNLNCAGGTTNPCSLTTLLHEMGHVVGLYHEFTRTDVEIKIVDRHRGAERLAQLAQPDAGA